MTEIENRAQFVKKETAEPDVAGETISAALRGADRQYLAELYLTIWTSSRNKQESNLIDLRAEAEEKLGYDPIPFMFYHELEVPDFEPKPLRLVDTLTFENMSSKKARLLPKGKIAAIVDDFSLVVLNKIEDTKNLNSENTQFTVRDFHQFSSTKISYGSNSEFHYGDVNDLSKTEKVELGTNIRKARLLQNGDIVVCNDKGHIYLYSNGGGSEDLLTEEDYGKLMVYDFQPSDSMIVLQVEWIIGGHKEIFVLSKEEDKWVKNGAIGKQLNCKEAQLTSSGAIIFSTGVRQNAFGNLETTLYKATRKERGAFEFNPIIKDETGITQFCYVNENQIFIGKFDGNLISVTYKEGTWNKESVAKFRFPITSIKAYADGRVLVTESPGLGTSEDVKFHIFHSQ